MKIEVANGEIFDKYSILQLKLSKIKDTAKLESIRKEHSKVRTAYLLILSECEDSMAQAARVAYSKLAEVNARLWEIEDSIRDKERNKEFDSDFIELARQVYIQNDLRCQIKNDINIITGSDFTEEKSYAKYL